LVKRERVAAVWALLRLNHPLLASRVEMHAYNDVRFVYDAPASPDEALRSANESLEYRTQTKDELLDSYLNGPRTLSNARLSYLIVSRPGMPVSQHCEHTARQNEDDEEVELMICATHFLGDGMALHAFANDFFTLLNGGSSLEELKVKLREKWESCLENVEDESLVLPSSMESKLPPQTTSKFRRAAAKVDFQCSQEKFIGGQAFPRLRPAKPRQTIVPTISFDEAKTKRMLQTCKANGVSISAALFAICDVVWARMLKASSAASKDRKNQELPTMMYSALNMRPYLVSPSSERSATNQSYWYLAVGYFNVILPSFLPSSSEDEKKVFWARARSAKEQSGKAAKHRFLVDRAREMALLRGERARGWAKEDDERAAGTFVPPAPVPQAQAQPKKPTVPSTALVGLSLLGNLDGTYKHALYTSMELHTLTTGSRQRSGGMLVFGYTFKGRLWVSLGYDVGAFEGQVVQEWWKGVQSGVEEFLS
jgi:hypothetical protein